MDEFEISESEQVSNVKNLLTDEVSYRVFVLSTFRDLNQRMKYQEKLLETHIGEVGEIKNDMRKLLAEHSVCTKRVNDSFTYEDTWKWMKRVKEIWNIITQKVVIWIFFAAAFLMAYLYMTHFMTSHQRTQVKPNQQTQSVEDW